MTMTRSLLRRLASAAAIVALLTGAAAAQFPTPSVSLQPEQRKLTPDELARQKAIDQAYRSATAKIPEKKVDDPWSDVRPATPGPAAKKKQQ